MSGGRADEGTPVVPTRLAIKVASVVLAAVVSALALAATLAPSAFAAAAIGQLPITPAPTGCGTTPLDAFQPTPNSGGDYAVPAGGAAITSWGTFARSATNQAVTFKIFRHVTGIGDPNVWLVVGHDGPRPLTPGVLNTFPVNIAVQPGDQIGFNLGNPDPAAQGLACSFPAPGESNRIRSGDLADGVTGDFTLQTSDLRLNLEAVVALRPSNDFGLGKTKRNKRKGTATIRVNVPGPGSLTLSGKGLKAQRPAASATVSKTVPSAEAVKLQIKPKAAKKAKLNRRGKLRVRVKVTYTPTGEVAGIPKTLTRKIKLIKVD